jgi:membrane protein YdbS with pleckstrin-like domain
MQSSLKQMLVLGIIVGANLCLFIMAMVSVFFGVNPSPSFSTLALALIVMIWESFPIMQLLNQYNKHDQ